ncbi:MAG: hypothetical protein WCS31_18770 [Verrucomicrobiae bacterium]
MSDPIEPPEVVRLGDLEPDTSPSRVIVKDGTIWIEGPYRYPIDVDRITDLRDLLAWVRHLTRKAWVTRKILGEFIDVVAALQGIHTRIGK